MVSFPGASTANCPRRRGSISVIASFLATYLPESMVDMGGAARFTPNSTERLFMHIGKALGPLGGLIRDSYILYI